MRLLCVTLLLALVAIIALHWLRNGDDGGNGIRESPASKKSRRVTRRIERPSQPSSAEPTVASNALPAVIKMPRPPVSNVTTALSNEGRVETLLDGTIVTSRVHVVFKRPFERGLQVALRPGGYGASAIMSLKTRYSEEQIVSMLKEITKPEEDDDEDVAALKNRVQKLKEDILLKINEGRSAYDVLDELRRQCADELSLRNEVDRLVRDAARTGDAKVVGEAVRKTNEILTKSGLPAKQAPIKYRQEIAEIEAAERAVQDGDRQEDATELNRAIEDSFK